jgi:GntR family transcriptional regulator/MocR family aminotransferase
MDRHIRKLGAVYNERREALVTALREFVGVRRITITREHGGVFLLCKIRSEKSANEICERLANQGVGLMSTEGFYSRPPGGNEFIFGFGALSVEQIREGVRRLAKVL